MRRIDDTVDRRRTASGGGDGAARARARRGRWLAGVAGVVGPVLFTVTFLVLERVGGTFSAVRMPVSALAAGPHGWVQQVNFVVFGLLTVVFAVGLHRGLRPTRWGMAGPALLVVSGVGLLLAAAFPLQRDAAGSVHDPGGHVVAGTLFFGASALALVVLSRRIGADPAWSGLAAWTLAAGLVCVAGAVVMRIYAIPVDGPLHDWVGLLQRVTILLALFPARVALAVRLLRTGRAVPRYKDQA